MRKARKLNLPSCGTSPPVIVHIITQLELGGAQLATLRQCLPPGVSAGPRHLICGPGGLLFAEAQRALGDRLHVAASLQRKVDPRADLQAFFQVRRLLKKIRRCSDGAPLWVHTHSSKAGIVGRWAAFSLRAQRIAHSVHGFGHHRAYDPPLRFAAYAWAERLTAWTTDGFTADSCANVERLHDEGLLPPDSTKPVEVVRCNISLQPFAEPAGSSVALRAALGLPPQAPVVLQVGCLKPQKDPLTFVRLAAQVKNLLPDAHFLMAGDGVLNAAVRAEAKSLGLTDCLHLLGWRRDVAALLHLADVVVLTSLWEGLPQVFGQAMAAGRPVVATWVDGAAEAIAHGETGLLYAPGDALGMAQGVLRLLHDPQRRQAMGAAAKKRAAQFGETPMLAALERFYGRLAVA
jgi:glycosyltransferase involved in cell wall biosynthesis